MEQHPADRGKPDDDDGGRDRPAADADIADGLPLGFVLRALNRPADAEAAFRQSIERDPDFLEAHYQLGNLLRETQRPGDAEPSYRRVLALNPKHHQAHNNLGAALGELSRFDEAADEKAVSDYCTKRIKDPKAAEYTIGVAKNQSCERNGIAYCTSR